MTTTELPSKDIHIKYKNFTLEKIEKVRRQNMKGMDKYHVPLPPYYIYVQFYFISLTESFINRKNIDTTWKAVLP